MPQANELSAIEIAQLKDRISELEFALEAILEEVCFDEIYQIANVALQKNKDE